MKELIIVCLIALVITPILSSFNPFHLQENEAEDLPEKLFNTNHKITAGSGVIACLSQESLDKMSQFFSVKDVVAMNDMMARGLCISLLKDDKLLGLKDACDSTSKTSIFIPEGKTSRFYIPCFAVK